MSECISPTSTRLHKIEKQFVDLWCGSKVRSRLYEEWDPEGDHPTLVFPKIGSSLLGGTFFLEMSGRGVLVLVFSLSFLLLLSLVSEVIVSYATRCSVKSHLKQTIYVTNCVAVVARYPKHFEFFHSRSSLRLP